ncbi:hypothetical protein MKW94_008597 [Papaver nudicaule]|uniref:DUF1771 domain-containing protein n=1 Tax=Papaver nudicaule TaxID=74823 RepID=A0AA41W006_PAPNU|nr:hypothetical protein [Papaver nudicaule]
MAELKVSSSRTLEYDLEEKKILNGLIDAFGSSFTLREICSAFCKAGSNPDMAAEILYDCEGNNSNASFPVTYEKKKKKSTSPEPLPESVANRSGCADRNLKGSKSKKLSVSIGTVSSVLGKGYAKTNTAASGPVRATKPLKVDINDFLIDEPIDGDVTSDSAAMKDQMHTGIEEFLFKMLGSGFQLDMDVIREVLGACGYDAQKSMERLTDLSALKMKNGKDIIGGSTPKIAESPKFKSSSSESSEQMDLPKSRDKEKYDLQKEVLASLFNVPERIEESPKSISRGRRVVQPRPGRKIVTEPYKDTEHSNGFVKLLQESNDESHVKEDSRYDVLRRVAKEHWITMKEYFKSAFDAYAKGDHALAEALTKEGQSYNLKAREADEMSNQLNLVPSEEQKSFVTTVDLRDYDKGEAISKMKFFLSTLFGIEGHLKVVIDDGDTKKASRRRRVLKFLEKESIKWTEEENQGTILIQMNEINPTELSFYGEKKASDDDEF